MLGLAVALGRVSRFAALRLLAATWIQVVQGIPLPVLIFLSYFGLGVTGFDVPALLGLPSAPELLHQLVTSFREFVAALSAELVGDTCP